MLEEFYTDFHQEMLDAEEALKDTRLKVPDEVSEEKCEICGRNLVVKTSRFGKFLACPGYPECKFTKAITEKMPGRCPKCGSAILKRKSKRGYAYYACERGAACGFMTWDVPTDQDCPVCGQTMFKRSGKGAMKPFCANPECSNFLPEDKRGYRRRKTDDAAASAEDSAPAAEEPLEHQGQLLQGNAHAPHDVHDLLVFRLPMLLLQLFQPGLLFTDFGLDLINLGLDFLAFACRHK